MTAPPFVAAEDAGAHFHREVIRQHVHWFMFVDIMREEEPNDRRLVVFDLAVPLFVKEITELHRYIPIQ